MSASHELAYLRLREAKACQLGNVAKDVSAKAIHFKMAEEYARRIATIEEQNLEI